jgi:hypothetical protein
MQRKMTRFALATIEEGVFAFPMRWDKASEPKPKLEPERRERRESCKFNESISFW